MTNIAKLTRGVRRTSVARFALLAILGASACENPVDTPKAGQVVFWTDQVSLVPIAVQPSGQPVTVITTAFSSRPSCGQAGAASYTLEPGNYSVTAANSSNVVWTGEAEITAGSCLAVRLYTSASSTINAEMTSE